MTAKIPAKVREQQINALPNIRFARWADGYRNKDSKVVCRCEIDGYEWVASVGNLVNQGSGCPRCCNARRLIPASERVEQINALHNITFIRWADGEYTGNKSRAVCRCEIDGYEWVAAVNKLLIQGTGCPQCSSKRRWTASERVEQINDRPNIRFIQWDGEYHGRTSKAVCRCDVGHEWSATVGHLLNTGSGCPNCAERGYNTSKPGTLYALRSECGTMVKIGISNDYEQRHRKLARATPFDWGCIELLHGDGVLIAKLEKEFHRRTEQMEFTEQFDGYTEWRKWDPRLPEWFAAWR